MHDKVKRCVVIMAAVKNQTARPSDIEEFFATLPDVLKHTAERLRYAGHTMKTAADIITDAGYDDAEESADVIQNADDILALADVLDGGTK